MRELFPEGPRKIAKYLVQYVNANLITIQNDKITFGKISLPFDRLLKETGKTKEELTKDLCAKCKNVVDLKKFVQKFEYICSNCEYRMEDIDKQYLICPKCKKLMQKKPLKIKLCSCGHDRFITEFDLSSIVAVDTVLISSRHLYRMPYSLHEKTGLASIPFDIKHILKFEKEEANTSKIKPYPFLDRSAARGEAEMLFSKAFDQTSGNDDKERMKTKKMFEKEKSEKTYQNLQADTAAVPEEFFPPCIKKISAGLEDGKKRALFILINFLASCNWEHEKIEEYLLKWNEKNKPDKLRETYITGQIRYYKTQKEKIAPPNCDNRGYMIDTQFCNPDGLCARIKNPAQYAKRRAYLVNISTPVKKPKKEPKTPSKQRPVENKKSKDPEFDKNNNTEN